MRNLEHCQIIAGVVAESLSPYSHFEEVEELKTLVAAWLDNRIQIQGSEVIFGFSESNSEVGMIPSLSHSPE
jgi:hypothetical protein